MKIFKKVTAVFLVFIVVMGVFPFEILANYQNNVSDLTVTDMSSATTGATDYVLNLNWTRPQPSAVADTGAVQPEGSNLTHTATEYDLFFRNASKPEAYGVRYDNAIPDVGTSSGQSKQLSNLPLDSGSLYMFKVLPYHEHTYAKTVTTNGVPVTTYVQERAPIDSATTLSESLYLTDIGVSAEGEGKSITVTWDNPKIDGKQVFYGYRLYYVVGGSTIASPMPDSPNVDVYMDDPGLSVATDGKLQFTIQDPTLEIGKFYAVKVEPMVAHNSLLRDASTSTKTIRVNDKTYQIAYTNKRREYRDNSAYIKPRLYVKPLGLDKLEITWDSLRNSNQNITKIEVYESASDNFQPPKLLGTITGQDARNYNYWIEDRPTVMMYYKVIIYYDDGTPGGSSMQTNEEPYNPTHEEFDPYIPTIISIAPTDTSPFSLDVIWQAFVRTPYSDDERANINTTIGKYVDKNVEYDVWVTDKSDNFDKMDDSHKIGTFDASTLTEVMTRLNNIDVLGYTSVFTTYVGLDATGAFVSKPLEGNKVYQIKIVATRKLSGEESYPAYGSCYIPPEGDISTIPLMMAKPPLRIARDADGAEMIDDESITIQWDKKWFEAYDETKNEWHTKIGVDANGNILFGEAANDANTIILLNNPDYQIYPAGESKPNMTASLEKIRAALSAANLPSDKQNLLPIRFMDLGNANYEIHVVEYDYMLESTTGSANAYENYLNGLLGDSEEAVDKWRQITGTGDASHPMYTVTEADAPADSQGSLKANTPYVIFFRPYMTIDGKKTSYYPSFVTATTLLAREPIEIIPTVPNLEPVSEADTLVTVRWEASEALQYELAFSELLSNYSDGGTVIPWDDIAKDGEVKTENGKRYMYYTITGLFPETSYYIWMRSSVENALGVATSAWSNPIYMTTTEIVTPDPPKNLGSASEDDLAIYNKENDTLYTPTSESYIIAQWMRDYNDINNTEGGEAATTGGTSTGGSAEALLSPNILTTYMAKFNELVANKKYYIRAKTVLTVTRAGGQDAQGGITREYSYVVQMSRTSDFKDPIEITIPPLGSEEVDPLNMRRKESAWSETIWLNSDKWTGEYDGNVNDNLYPLPTQDYEITYDSPTETLNFRFRTNQKDANGNNDNLVDQRFISRLIQNKTFVYEVDMTKYDNRAVSNRNIELPYSIYKAFEEKKISMKIKADNATITFNPGAVGTAEVKSLGDFGANATVKLMIGTNANGTPRLTAEESYASKPQKLSVQVITPGRTVTLANLATKVNVDLKLENRYVSLDQNVGTYVADANTVGWERVQSTYNNVTGTMSFETKKLANYAAVAKSTPLSSVVDDSRDAMYNVTSKLDITDMGNYQPTAQINANQFNNIVAAVANGRMSVAMNAGMSDADFQALGKRKMLISGMAVSNEAGINTLVELYELKTKTSIKSYPSVQETGYINIANADPAYQIALLKADELGFFGNNLSTDPKSGMTFSQVLYIIDIIMADAGM